VVARCNSAERRPTTCRRRPRRPRLGAYRPDPALRVTRSPWALRGRQEHLGTIRAEHIYRWVQRFTPPLAEAARPCRHAVGNRWHVDETYGKVAGRWRYLYRAVDQFGQVFEILGSAQRDGRAARRFFEYAIGTTKTMPMEVVTDPYQWWT